MAITALEYLVFSSLRARNMLPPRPRVLELGESNWYGDVSLEQLEVDIRRFVTDEARREALLAKLQNCISAGVRDRVYEIASIFWTVFADPLSYSAIDPGMPHSKYRFDLNQPVPLDEKFDVTVNIGTAEHVFNVYQFFKTAHERTVENGHMIHTSPFTGWPDHGFYCFQPTFFYDLARANGYHVVGMTLAQLEPFKFVQVARHDQVPELIRSGQIPSSSYINVVYQKAPEPREFAVPMQAYYAGVLSPEHKRAWAQLR